MSALGPAAGGGPARLERIVVVGNGIAGLTAADTLRAQGYAGELVLVGEEAHPAYSRPALSKALLRDEEDLTSHQLPPSDHGATELLGRTAVGLDVDRRVVRLDSGGELGYDGLVIATGCRPRRLGPPGSGELTMRTLEDAVRLRSLIADRPSVVVVGGGPLGMEIASGCLAAGCSVTVVTQGPPLVAQLGEFLSARIMSAAVTQGLRVVETVGAEVIGTGADTAVRLAEGPWLEADLVVTAAGDAPNVEWLADSGLLSGGVLEVDSRGRVRAEIVAAGDVAAWPTPGGCRRSPLWSSAIEQSKVAATALLHGDEAPELDLRPYFWTEQFGLSLKAVGTLPAVGDPVWLDGDEDADPSGPALLRWDGGDGGAVDGAGAVVAVNYRIPIPRLRKLAAAVPAPA